MVKTKVGRPSRDPEVALDCYLRYLNDQTDSQIGLHYHWKRRKDDHGRLQCMTARRHIGEGKKIYERKGLLREETFGIKFNMPVRVRRGSKPINK